MTDFQRLGKYEIIQEIGRGGFAVVYKARDTALDRVVALKVLHPYWAADPGFAARFQREARTAARLRHPNIVTIHEADEAEGQLYIAMEYLPGRTLQALLEEEGALPLERALPILEQLADALDNAHGQGVVHRDIKPANVMVEETARGLQATLMDFGLVKAMAESSVLTSHGTLLGSPEYMAPEQADPERAAGVSPAADRYALGIVAYQMLTGRVPFPGNTPATLNAHEHKPVPPPRSLRPDLPRAMEKALLKMLAKAPADRFVSAGAFVTRLRDALLAEGKARQQREQLGSLYRRLKAAADAADWPEVLALGGQIRALEPGYRDVRRLMDQTKSQMRTRSVPDRPIWLVLAGFGGLLILMGVLAFLCTRVEPMRTWLATDTPTATSTFLVTDTLPPTSTETHTPTTTSTREISGPPAGEPWTRPADDAVMVYVPAGKFEMGSSDEEVDYALQLCNEYLEDCTRSWFEDEQPVHAVAMDAFWIDRTEVTNAQYAAFLNDQGNQTEGGATWLDIESVDCLIEKSGEEFQSKNGYADHPVIGVFWYGAATYCEWAGARLPTEAEWEFAARGEEQSIYPWGDEFDCSRGNFDDETEIDDHVVPGGERCDGYVRTAPVGSFPDGASWCGALDMAGNVWEWVADWHGDYPSGAQTNPTGPATGEYRVVRGGSWSSYSHYVRGANRLGGRPDITRPDSGFRCARGSD